MSSLDLGELRGPLAESTAARLDELEAFASLDSTNTYLLDQSAPAPGRFRVAIADEQTGGRGRYSRRWLSPPGAGLYLSLGYTFERAPAQLPALTLALGVGVITALDSLASGAFQLKWPNDIIVRDGKLGGILTETQSRAGDGVTVVTGVGLNMNLPAAFDAGSDSGWALRAVDLAGILESVPSREWLAGTLVEALVGTLVRFETSGFALFADEWRARDWLKGREVVIELPGREIAGTADGVEPSGELIVRGPEGRTRVASGSITLVSGPVGPA